MMNKQREAFSLIMAIIVIVLMATVAMLIMNMSGKMVKTTTTQYQREQAVLYAKSYTEYAIMGVMANDRNTTTCLNEITAKVDNYSIDNYSIRTVISYIGNSDLASSSCAKVISSAVVTPESPLNIIVDVFVSYPDTDHPDDLNMTYHRRSLQKI